MSCLYFRGRVEDAHHVKLIDKYCGLTPGVADDLAEDAADEAGVIKVSKRACYLGADCDVATGVYDANSSIVTQNHVVISVEDRISGLFTHCDVSAAGCVRIERVITHRGILGARRV